MGYIMPSIERITKKGLKIANRTYPKSVAKDLKITRDEWSFLSIALIEELYYKKKPLSNIWAGIKDEVTEDYQLSPGSKERQKLLSGLLSLVMGIRKI